jgi:Arylsulfotransferase (ASST)
MNMTRRQLLERAGFAAAGVAGLGLVADRLGVGSPEVALAGTGPSAGDGLMHFITRPDLTPPVVKLSPSRVGNDGDYIFMNAPWTDGSPGGSVIRDGMGDLVWMSSNTIGHRRMDVNAQTYRGAPVLTWWEGALTVSDYGLGVGMIADTSYRTTHVVRAHHGLQADLHEFNLTAQGTALITAYRQSVADLSAVGGPVRGSSSSGTAWTTCR